MSHKKITRRRFLRDMSIACTCGSLLGTVATPRRLLGADGKQKSQPGFAQMEYRTLGKTGLRVSALSFGVMRLSEPAVLHAALEMGINYFDTAHAYQNGNNEKMLGEVLKKAGRDKVLIATKIPPFRRMATIKVVESPQSMEERMNESLRRLQTDYVDVLFLHAIADPEWPVREEMLGLCERLKKSGKTRFAGISFHESGQLYVDIADRALQHGVYDVLLASLNFKSPPEHIAALKRARQKNVGIIAMKTQVGGYQQPVGSTLSAQQAALKWVLDCPFVDCAIPGMVNQEQLRENGGVVGKKLSWSDRKVLDRYYAGIRDFFCVRCGTCTGMCPSGVAISDVNRALMYAEGYGDYELARSTYQELPPAASGLACTSCTEPACRCINGIPIAERMRHAHAMLA